MAVRRTHRIPVDPFRFDPGASTSLDRIIQTQHYGSSHGKDMDEQTQQDMTGFSARPYSTIENTVIILKMLFSTQPHYPQNSSHRSFCRTQDGAHEQDLRMFPNA